MGKQHKEKEDPNLVQLKNGISIIDNHDVFRHLISWNLQIVGRKELGKKTAACSKADGTILVNKDMALAPKQWAYAIAHCILHNCFGHYDLDKVPGYTETDSSGEKTKKAAFNKKLWNIACDIYVDRFLNDIRLGEPLNQSPVGSIPFSIMEDELKIYDYLMRENWNEDNHIYGVGSIDSMDMVGLEKPLEYKINRWGEQEKNEYASSFAYHLANSVSNAVYKAADREIECSRGREIAGWFINTFPLLGAIASSFKIVDDIEACRKYDISIAAVDAFEGVIFMNTSKNLSDNEWRFVMAHEFLHAALLHHRRAAGRDPYLWNIATDYVINGWLFEMQIGVMPEGVLYDPALRNKSAEEIYDIIYQDIRTYMRLNTFRGNGQGDIMGRRTPGTFGTGERGVSLDEFYRNALTQGFEYEISMRGRGFIPAGLVEEIRALAMPPIPWDVRLSEWFNAHIRPLEKHRSYAHPSRRQSCTPDIPRARYVVTESGDTSRTFGVIIDTSGSMTTSEIGKALGAVASYAASRDVFAARVIFCDANAYDAGYMTPDEIAGRVKVIGRGGTRLQPAVDMLQEAKDFPKDGPILIITDGEIDKHLDLKREHAFILPGGCRLPFRARGEVFNM
ncbi:vWA domain-containing protein [Butyrivibrio sp. VCD2006]|uniref:vWA domain-containing protein n=1 Tax=Butyrivibrio sp. VCD2006 TaxID=1280664 RepID=UPI000409735D|nr:hypothetical protein [Butyrivibrio sp. VCD2006]